MGRTDRGEKEGERRTEREGGEKEGERVRRRGGEEERGRGSRSGVSKSGPRGPLSCMF